MIERCRVRALATCCSFALVSTVAALPARAQTPPQNALPSAQEVRPPTPETRKPSTAHVDSRTAFEQRPCPFLDSPIRLTLSKVEFARPDGSALQPEIAAALAGMSLPEGDQPLKVVCEVRDDANEALHRGGWIASVQVPPQQINGGTLRLNVVTARIVETRIRGDAGPYENMLRKRIADLQAMDPLNERAAEHLLLVAGDTPGLDIQLTLRPAATGQGDVIGEMNVQFRRFAVLGNAQNYNSRQLGRETGYVRGEIYGLTGLGDITYIGASTTADFYEQKIAQIGHIMTVDGHGTTVGARFSYAWSRPDLGELSLHTNTLIAGFDVTRPLLRSVNRNLGVAAGFDYVDQISNVHSEGGSSPLTTDKLRIGFLSLSGDARGLRRDGSQSWSLRGRMEVRKGFDILGATAPGFADGNLQSRIDGNARAWVLRGDFLGSLGFGRYFALAGQVQGQWANDPLLNYEEFSLGNLTIGRGYDPGANSGDRAVGLRGEAQVNLPILTQVNTQLFGFYDWVYLTNLDRGSLEVDRHLRSYGGGLRLALPGKVLLELTYAHPMDKALTLDKQRPPNRVLVSLSFRFRDGAH